MPNFLFTPRTKCCHLNPAPQGLYNDSLSHDLECFAKYVGGGQVNWRLWRPRYMLSALHAEMKLTTLNYEWYHFHGFLGGVAPNDTVNFIWKSVFEGGVDDHDYGACENANLPLAQDIASAQAANSGKVVTSEFPTYDKEQRELVFTTLREACFGGGEECATIVYDEWLLDQILLLREQGLEHARLPWLWAHTAPNDLPPELATIGHAQGLVNNFVKWEHAWHQVGCWQQNASPAVFLKPAGCKELGERLSAHLCGLHAPLHKGLLEGLNATPLGKVLCECRLIYEDGRIQQATRGIAYCVEQIDCLETYYSLQLLLRRLALSTWSNGCECEGLIERCVGSFVRRFGREVFVRRVEGGWLETVLNLPEKVFQETLDWLENKAADQKRKSNALEKVSSAENKETMKDILDL